MDFRQLESFICAADHRSFTEAADRLFLSQPTISAHIRSLENELQAQLIRRTTKNFELTADGERLYEYAASLLHLKNKVLTEFSDLHKQSLYIGASSIPGKYILPSLLAAYHKAAPEINFKVFHGDSGDVLNKISDGSYDLGFVGTRKDCDLHFVPVAEDELLIAAPNTPYFQKKSEEKVPLRELLREPFIMRADESGTRQEADHWLDQQNISRQDLNIIAYIDDAETLRNAIVNGLGISIISRRMAEYPDFRKDLLLFTPDKKRVTRKLYLAYQESRWIPEAVQNFIDFVLHRPTAADH